MKNKQIKKLVGTLIFVLVLSFGIVSAANAGTFNPFLGNWEALDSDNSHLQMTISEPSPGVFRLIWQDDYWSICSGGPGFGRGTGSMDGSNPNLMHTSFDLYCGNSFWGTLAMDIEYDPGTDKFTDITFGTIWNRVGRTKSPFPGKWEATDVDASNLRLTISERGEGIFRLIWQDDYWTVCAGGPGFGRGTGTIDAYNLYLMHTSIDIYCGSFYWGTLAMDFEYNPATDTIMNTPLGPVIWHRVTGP